jgi:hypothetical protein
MVTANIQAISSLRQQVVAQQQNSRDIALRGIDPNWALLGGLIAIGLALMLISWRLMRRLIASSQ